MSEAAFLLVDDEKIVLDSLKHELRQHFGLSYLYETAESVPEAWEVIEELSEEGCRVVVVVSDWLMPGVRGDAFLTELKYRHPETIRILLTGQADADALRRVEQSEAAQLIFSKPWSSSEIEESIRSALGKR